jgi:hypothetical protein
MSGFNHYDSADSYSQPYPKSFVATRAFNNDFFTYTVTKNAALQTIGTLGFVTTDAARCPIGRVLHANGKKLYPNVNPMDTFPGGSSLLTGKKFLVGVYDPISLLSGFIDPTSSMFSKYDQLLDNAFDLGPTANTAVYGSSAPPLGGQAGRLTLSEAAVNDRGSLAVPLTSSCGQATGVISGAGTSQDVTIYTTACTVNSKIFLTVTAGGTIWVSQVGATEANKFVFRANGSTNVNWLVVN